MVEGKDNECKDFFRKNILFSFEYFTHCLEHLSIQQFHFCEDNLWKYENQLSDRAVSVQEVCGARSQISVQQMNCRIKNKYIWRNMIHVHKNIKTTLTSTKILYSPFIHFFLSFTTFSNKVQTNLQNCFFFFKKVKNKGQNLFFENWQREGNPRSSLYRTKQKIDVRGESETETKKVYSLSFVIYCLLCKYVGTEQIMFHKFVYKHLHLLIFCYSCLLFCSCWNLSLRAVWAPGAQIHWLPSLCTTPSTSFTPSFLSLSFALDFCSRTHSHSHILSCHPS